jgi:hypothetical protein
MDFPEQVLTKGKKGKLEVRTLDHRGQYVMSKYVDPDTKALADAKRKLTLKDEEGRLIEYFIIPLRDPKRSLLIYPEKEEKDRQVWNEKTGKAEEMWKE